MSKRLCLVGATGLVGRAVIERAVSRSDVRIVGVARREIPLPYGARMEMLLAEPSGWPDAIASANAEVLVCALGTTIRKAGSQEAFRAVDHDLVLDTARAARAAGIERMIVISSVGADLAAKNSYLRTKGEVENDVGKLGFKRLDILRPGLLVGQREDDPRPAERAGMLFSPLIDLVLQGKYRKYRSIKVSRLADVIFALAFEKAGGKFVHEHDAFARILRRVGD
ncbi:MAG: NAD(P)H-binding protein [Sphingomonadaceae bacterium]